MEKTYKLTSLFFGLVLLVIFWGFHRTYTVFFPKFEGFQTVQHVHGALMMTWMLMLITQPLLILSGKAQVHRLIGKISYVIAPLVVISIFLVMRMSFYHQKETLPLPVAQGGIFLQIPMMIAFLVMYLLAIGNKHRTSHHMRYMIGTSFLMIGPGLGRALIIYFGVPFQEAVFYADYLVMAIAATLLITDLVNKRPWVPYTVVLSLLVFCHVLFAERMSAPLQTVAQWFTTTLF